MHDGHGHHHHHGDGGHTHGPSENGFTSMEEARALLKYMAGHNKSHTEELAFLSDLLGENEKPILAETVELYNAANAKLDELLAAVESAAASESAADEAGEEV